MFDLKFRFVTAARYAPGACIVRWSVFPHAHPRTDTRFSIFRSSSPAGPWELVEEDRDSFQYVDYGVYSPVISRPYYYKIRAASATGHGFIDSAPTPALPESDNIAQEMIRKKLTFMLVKTGGPIAALIRKTWGPNCNRCYNHQRQVASDPNCPDCYGTGYTGGYLSPYYTPAIMNPPKKAIVSAGIEYDVSKTYIEVASVPVLGPDDVIIDIRNNIRYGISEVTPAWHRQALVSQVCTINRLDENSTVYAIPVQGPGSVEYGHGWDLLGEANMHDTLKITHVVPS